MGEYYYNKKFNSHRINERWLPLSQFGAVNSGRGSTRRARRKE